MVFPSISLWASSPPEGTSSRSPASWVIDVARRPKIIPSMHSSNPDTATGRICKTSNNSGCLCWAIRWRYSTIRPKIFSWVISMAEIIFPLNNALPRCFCSACHRCSTFELRSLESCSGLPLIWTIAEGLNLVTESMMKKNGGRIDCQMLLGNLNRLMTILYFVHYKNPGKHNEHK